MAVLGVLWRPFFPPAMILLVAAVLAALALLAFWRARKLAPATAALTAAMRLALVAAVAVLLLGPSVLPPASTSPGRPTLTFLVDTSASMQTPDADGQARYDFITSRWLNAERLAAWRRHYDVRVLGFGESTQPLPDGALRHPAAEVATAGVSNVIGSVVSALASLPAAGVDKPPGAVVVLSDGRDTLIASGGGAAGGGTFGGSALFAAGRTAPVHTVALGGPTLQRDLTVVAVPLQEYLLAGEPGQIAVRVVAPTGVGAATLHLRGPGVDETHPIAFDNSNAARLTLPIEQDQPGQYEYEVEVEPLAGEVELRNNRQPVFIEVTKQRLRVLLLEGEPYWDTKFLAQSLRKDERVELTQIVQVSPQKQQKIVSRVDMSNEATAADAEKRRLGVPATAEAFRAYDVVILGAGMGHVLDPQSAIALRDYVMDHGGRVVFARGRPYDAGTPMGGLIGEALAPIEPVVWGGHTLRDQPLRFTDTGASHPAFAFAETIADRQRIFGQLPALLAAPAVEREKAGAQVLARTGGGLSGFSGPGTGQPAIVSMPVGRGAVLAVLGEGLWRWRLAGRDHPELAEAFDRFWSNSVRWLVMGGDYQPGRELAVRLSRRSVQLGEPITIDISDRALARRGVVAEVVGPDGERHTLALAPIAGGGRQRATYEPREPGVYRVIASADGSEPIEAGFNVYELDLERLECSADPHQMRMLAEESGGLVLDPYHPEALDDALRRQREARIVPLRPEYAWDEAWVMVALLGWMGGEWLLRKGGGLL